MSITGDTPCTQPNPVDLTAAEEGGFVVTFPHVREAITQGEDMADALKHAADALESALSFYTDAGKAPLKTGAG